jgi:hypothetical protein
VNIQLQLDIAIENI